jgi:hypothetical protein
MLWSTFATLLNFHDRMPCTDRGAIEHLHQGYDGHPTDRISQIYDITSPSRWHEFYILFSIDSNRLS